MTDRRDDETAGESFSPACSMREADDVYMGYMTQDELIAFLNELLEAERAGARVTLESARAASSEPIAQLISDTVVSRRHFFFVAPDWRHVTGTMMAALGGLRGFVGERR